MAVKKKKRSVLKKQRQDARRRIRNSAIKSRVKTAIKKARESIIENKPELKTFLKSALGEIDRAVSKGVLHKRTAARKKSRLMKMANKLAAGINEPKQ
jgi:small subunit ribosomal protein S20